MLDADTSTEFVFGPLSTEAGRAQRARTLRVGLQHDAVLSPIDPRPSEPIVITVRAGVGAVLKTATLCYTIDGALPEMNHSSTVCVRMVRTAIAWDTLAWVYIETWNATIPAQPAGTRVRYIITATTLDDRVIACPWIEPTTSPEDYDQHYLVRLQRYGSPRVFEFTIDTTTTSEWLRSAVIYQIFVDRFAPDPDRSFADATNLSGFCGGTLRGIANRLDYLRDLGVTCLWLTPIFPSPSHHGYDATDYYSTNSRLGSETDLRELITAAQHNGIYVILDFVANHISKDHPAFRSAQHDPASSYREWFFFQDNAYACFYDLPDLPIVNTDQPAVRDYLIGAAQHWLSLGCDGFRLDHAHGATHGFWSAFRAATRAVKPDAAIFGEITDTPELMRSFAGRMDGVLDFHLLELLRGFFAFQSITVSQFDRALRQHFVYFADDLILPSFLDNHDMNRFLWIVGGDTRRLKLAALCQFTLPQPPIVYYGTEVGLSQRQAVGRLEEARLPMLWGDRQNKSLLNFYRNLIALRKQTPDAWSQPRETVLIDDEQGVYVYCCGVYTVYLNNSGAPAAIACQSTELVLTTEVDTTLNSARIHLSPFGGAVCRSG
jgi:cyclomaltodextrinase